MDLGYPNASTEVADRGGGVSTPAHATDGGEAGVVPSVDGLPLHQFQELPLAQYRVRQIESRELDLLGVVHIKLLEEPVI